MRTNLGPDSYGVVVLHPKKRGQTSGGFRLTLNHQMEIFAAIAGFRSSQELAPERGMVQTHFQTQANPPPAEINLSALPGLGFDDSFFESSRDWDHAWDWRCSRQ